MECIIKHTLLIFSLLFSLSIFSETDRLVNIERQTKKYQLLKVRIDAELARAKLESEQAEMARKQKEAEDIRKAEQASVTPDSGIATTNEYIANKWDFINRSVDTFFTNKESPAENRSSIFLSLSGTKSEGQKISNDVNFKVRFDLPNTTKNLKIIIEQQQDEIGNVLSDSSVPNTKAVEKNGKPVSQKVSYYTAGANFLLQKKNQFTSQLKFGIRLDMPINPSVKLDLQKDYKSNIVNVSLAQKIFFYRQEGLQEISQVSFNRKLNDIFQLDQINSLVWADENDVFLLRHSLILTQALAKEKSLTYSIGANARLSPAFYYESYDASLSYSQRLYQEWLFTSFTIGANFPKGNDFKDNKFVQLRFDIFFKEKQN